MKACQPKNSKKCCSAQFLFTAEKIWKIWKIWLNRVLYSSYKYNDLALLQKHKNCCEEDDAKCVNYRGTLSVTKSGYECQPWNNPYVHYSYFKPEE